MVTMIMIVAMIVMINVDIMIGNENVGKSVNEYMNNNVKTFVNKKKIVVNGKKGTVIGIKNG